MSLFFIQKYIVVMIIQLLIEMQNTVNSSPITLVKVPPPKWPILCRVGR